MALNTTKEDRIISSGIVAENGIRWCSNILTELLSSQIGPHYPETREVMKEACLLLYKANSTLSEELNRLSSAAKGRTP